MVRKPHSSPHCPPSSSGVYERVAEAEIAIEGELDRFAPVGGDAHEEADWPSWQKELSKREFEVVVLLTDGLRDAEVAAKLGISRATVQTHVRHVYEKLGVHTRAAMIFESTALLGTRPRPRR
jgi:DNA-binding NarL/FixJ family response regulator